VLYVIGVLVNFSNSQYVPSLVGGLTIGLVATYLFLWLICTGIIWLWRKVGVGGFLLLLVVVFLVTLGIINSNSIPFFFSLGTPTSTPTLRSAPTVTKFLTPTERSFSVPPGCIIWFNVSFDDVGDDFNCVLGNVERIQGEVGNYRLFFTVGEPLPDGSTWNYQGSTTFYLIVDKSNSYPSISVGDCIYSGGVVGINENNILFMRVKGNLNLCE